MLAITKRQVRRRVAEEEDNNLISGNILLYKTGKSLSVTPEPYACVSS